MEGPAGRDKNVSEQIMGFPYPNPLFWIGYYTNLDVNIDFLDVENGTDLDRCRIVNGYFLSWIIHAYMLFFMMRNNSLTKVIERQNNSK